MDGSGEIAGSEAEGRTCFVVSAFGSSPEEQRAHKQVLRHLVRKVLEPDYAVIRADEIDDEGLITHQVIEHLLEDDLVIADLTGLNPNVFYEIAVRHAARKPIVHLITKGQEIPFDVANMRAVPYALDDPDVLETAQEELRRKVKAIEDSGFEAAANPISAARDVWLLRESEEPDIRQAGDFLAALNDLRDEVRSLGRRAGDTSGDGTRGAIAQAELIDAVRRLGPVETPFLAGYLNISLELARAALSFAERDGKVVQRGDGAWTVAPAGAPEE